MYVFVYGCFICVVVHVLSQVCGCCTLRLFYVSGWLSMCVTVTCVWLCMCVVIVCMWVLYMCDCCMCVWLL